MSIQELAERLRSRFEYRERDDGSKFWRFDHDGPDGPALLDLCRAAHDDGNRLPDDQRYEMIVRSLDELAEADDDELEDVRLEPPIYTHDLTTWLASSNDRYGYCDEAISEFGPFDSTISLLTAGWDCEASGVTYSVLRSLRELLDDEDGS